MKFYRYRECGLDNVYLLDGYELKSTKYGESLKVHDIEGLHRAIGVSLATAPRKLTGREIRFLRLELGLSQRALADLIGKDEQTVANWEKEKKGRKPSPEGERLLRALYVERENGEVQLAKLLEKIAKLEEAMSHALHFSDSTGEWRAAEAA